MSLEDKKLDNPVWNSLNEPHKELCIQYDGLKFYDPEYCPFGGGDNPQITENGIYEYSQLSNNFFVVGNRPHLPDSLELKNELVCNQMVLNGPIHIPISEAILELKTENQKIDLFKLVNLVQPGYFKNRTVDLGTYFGIYRGNNLVAVTGERMKMERYTEVSAVVTHPEHLGQGLAKQLLKHTTDKIFQENKIPYLHVTETNYPAIKLYEKLGFVTRRSISFWNIIQK